MAKHASLSKSEKVLNAAKDMIVANFSAVIKKPQWKEFVKKVYFVILRSDVECQKALRAPCDVAVCSLEGHVRCGLWM